MSGAISENNYIVRGMTTLSFSLRYPVCCTVPIYIEYSFHKTVSRQNKLYTPKCYECSINMSILTTDDLQGMYIKNLER